MEQQERENTELSIDDILKEFGSIAPIKDEAKTAEPEEDVTVWDGKPIPAKTCNPTMPEDTVRIGDITKAVRERTADSDATIAFTPVNSDEEIEYNAFVPEEESKVEPYSQEWEPEYEQPMGEYVPPEPIVFRPKSRLQELKKKLIAGPERRYYELIELGFGKLQLAIIGCGFVAFLSVLTACMYAMGTVPENRMRLLVFSQLLGLLLSALLGSYQLMAGFSDLIKRRFSLNTLLVFSLIACIADGILCLQQVRVPCCAPFSLNMTMSLWSAYQKRNTELGQMDTMRKATRLNSVVLAPDFYEGKAGIVRGVGQVEDFMDHYQTPSTVEKTLQIYALVALFVSLGIGILAGFLTGLVTGIRFFSAALLISVPATAHIAISRPMAILERRLHKLGSVICGWQGVSAVNTRLAFPVDGEDLFPSGTMKMNGLKFYGSRNPDQVVAYATAVIMANGGGLAALFEQLLESRNGYHYDVQMLRHYPNGGVGGVVNQEAVLVGTRSFLKEMGVDVPNDARINQAVYVAVDGVLNGVFALTYSKVKVASGGLTTLCAYRGLTPVLTADDFMLTEEFIAEKFGVNTRRIAFPEWKMKKKLAQFQCGEEAKVIALTTQEGLAGAAFSVTGARALRTASVMGVEVQMLGGILGLIIMLALTVVHAEHLLTPENILLYELIWMIPGLMITEWTKYI